MKSERAGELLARERKRVTSALANLDREIRANAGDEDESDIGAGAARLHDDEVDVGLIEQLHSELELIARAEQRLANGTYGLSVESGEPIPDARLELIPWAERTAREQVRLERP